MPADTRSQLLEMHGVLEALNKQNLGPADRFVFGTGMLFFFISVLHFARRKSSTKRLLCWRSHKQNISSVYKSAALHNRRIWFVVPIRHITLSPRWFKWLTSNSTFV